MRTHAIVLVALLLLPTVGALALDPGPRLAPATPPAVAPEGPAVSATVDPGDPALDLPVPVDMPLLVDEAGDTMTGDLAFTGALGVQFPGGKLRADPNLLFGPNAVCIAAQPIAGCGFGDITAVTPLPGSGLTGGGASGDVTLGTDSGVLQRRVLDTCADGSSIRLIEEDGDVTCETDTDTTYDAGTGLLLASTTFSVDTTAIQRRISGVCSAGFSIRTIAGDGGVTCEEDTDTTYDAGTGLLLTSTTFTPDTSYLQRRVGACLAGTSIRSIAADGSVTCETDDSATYSAGPTMALAGTTFDVNLGVVQARVVSVCNAGSSIRIVHPDGEVTCETDDDTNSGGTVTSVASGAGLTGGPITGTGTLSVALGGIAHDMLADDAVDSNKVRDGSLRGPDVDPDHIQLRVASSCVAGTSIRAIARDGGVTCELDDDTTYAANGPLTLTGSTFDLASCAEGEVLKHGPSDWACGSDAGATYSAGAGLHLGGTTFSVANEGIVNTMLAPGAVDSDVTLDGSLVTADTDPSSIQRRVGGTCAIGEAIRVIGQDGTVTCEADDVGTYGAGNGLALTGATFRVLDCAADEILKVTGSAWACASDAGTTYSAGDGLSLVGTTFSVQDCAGNEILKRSPGDTMWDCAADADSGGDITGIQVTGGLTGGGGSGAVTIGVDPASIQTRVTGTCTAGNSIRVIAEDGTVTCEPDTDTTYLAGAGLALSGTTFRVKDCTTGQVLESGGANVWNCISPASTNTANTLVKRDASGNFAAGTITATLSGNAATASALAANPANCAAGEYAAGIAASGAAEGCALAGDITSVTAGTGLTGGGTSGAVTLNVDPAVVQNRVTGTCADGSAVDSITQAGGVTCENLWRRAGNAGTTPGTDFLGTTDNVAFEIKVNNARALRIEPGSTPNILGGHSGNWLGSSVVGAFVGGGGAVSFNNRVTDSFGTVAGGYNNSAGDASGNQWTAVNAFVGGGAYNNATGRDSVVAGGANNTAGLAHDAVLGGRSNVANGTESTVGGGQSNLANGTRAVVAGGFNNEASGLNAFVGAGGSSTASGAGAVVGGGLTNIASGSEATVGGGMSNVADGFQAAVGGGFSNAASSTQATVGGGFNNTASGPQSTVGGGDNNLASGSEATVGGGVGNAASNTRATIGGGLNNVASGIEATVGGGFNNTASNNRATVGGGNRNVANGFEATVGGGAGNTASSSQATVGGGDSNLANAIAATVGGGFNNTASNSQATVGGGFNNTASNSQATVGGGFNNTASGIQATVGGGDNNLASGGEATVGGGFNNTASNGQATVGGGDSNRASGTEATVGGGFHNTASNTQSTVGGGSNNVASAPLATVPGGRSNTAAGSSSLAAGTQARANHDGAFVWADNTLADFASLTPNQFRVRAGGGADFVGSATTGLLSISPNVDFNGDSELFWSERNTGTGCGINMTYKGSSTNRLHLRGGCDATFSDRLVIERSTSTILGVGRDPTGNALEVEGTASKTTAGDWAANSDARIKRDVRGLGGALATLEQLRPVAFRYTPEYMAAHPSIEEKDYYNFIAQEFEQVFPEYVKDSGEGGILQVDTYPAQVYAIAAIQELGHMVRERDLQIAALEDRLARIEARLGLASPALPEPQAFAPPAPKPVAETPLKPVTWSAEATLVAGAAEVAFPPAFAKVLSSAAPVDVSLTPHAGTGPLVVESQDRAHAVVMSLDGSGGSFTITVKGMSRGVAAP